MLGEPDPPSSSPNLSGEGFYLGRIQRTDKSAYLDHFQDPEIARNTLRIPFPYTEADADAWLDMREKEPRDPETMFAIREPDGYLIGGIGFVNKLAADTREAEFGYWLAKSYRGRDLMPRVIGVFARYAFETIGLRRLYALPFTFNTSSQRALEKAGFRREGILKQHFLKDGAYTDGIEYRLDADDAF